MPDIKPGDLALIISAVGSHDLIGQCVHVRDLIDTRGDVAFRGRTFLNLSPEPAAFIELRDGSLWLWSVSRLMPLRKAESPAMTAEAAMREVSHA